MSIVPPTIPGLSPFPGHNAPFPSVTAFAYVQGEALIDYVERIRQYMVEVIAPYSDDSANLVIESFVEQVDKVIADTNLALSEQAEAVNAAVATMIANGIEANDPVVTGIYNNLSSAFRVALNAQLLLDAQPDGFLADKYGVIGDGTKRTAELQALVNAVPEFSTIKFDPRKHYAWDQIVSDKALHFEGNGAKFTLTPLAGPAIAFRGSLAGVDVAITAPTLGDTTITVATGTGIQFAKDDIVIIRDSTIQMDWAGVPSGIVGREEPNKIISVVGDVITLATPVEWSYATLPRIRKVAKMLNGPSIRGFGDVHEPDQGTPAAADGGTTRPHIFAFELCDAALVEDVKVDGWGQHVANFYRCTRPVVRRVRGLNGYRTTVGGLGYLIRMNGCRGGKAIQCYTYRARHLFDVVSSYDCGSSECIAELSANVSFYTHGCYSRRTTSTNDWASGNVGWSCGNPAFGADYGFYITRPTYRGEHYAATHRSGSDNMIIVDADFVTPMRGVIGQFEGATRLRVEGGRVIRSGPLLNVGEYAIGSSKVYPNATDQGTGSTGDITIRNVYIQGERAVIDINSEGDIVIENVIFGGTGSDVAIALINVSRIVNSVPGPTPKSIKIAGCAAMPGYAYRNGISVAVAALNEQRIENNRFDAAINFTAGGLSIPVTAATVIANNSFKATAAPGIQVIGDIAAAKLAGARIFRNTPATVDSLGVMDGVTFRGDSTIALTARQTTEIQVWNVPLTAAKTANLITPAQPGDRFRIVRAASSTGASTLAVGATGKTLAPGQWADVVFDGVSAAWVLIGSGAL